MTNKKRKAGRPKLPANQRRAVVPVRLSRAEREPLEKAAKEQGAPLSTWIREALLSVIQK